MEDNTILLSFCLPVYNVESYLEQCIDSILGQNLESFEIVCIDDCSTDGSYKKLLNLREIHPEIRISRNEHNRGVSYSRNSALRQAVGKYVWFVDPDDLLAPGAGADFLTIAKERNAEAVLGSVFWFKDGSLPKKIPSGSGKIRKADFSDPKLFYQHSQDGTTSFGVWLGIYSRSFLLDNDLFFHENLGRMEDFVFHFETGLKAENFYLVERTGYYYRLRKGSITHLVKSDTKSDYYETCKLVLKILSDRLLSDEKYKFSIQAHMMDRKEAGALSLVQKSDTAYVKKELETLKKEGYYPYRHDSAAAFYKRSRKRAFLMYYLLPYEPLFWMIHYLFRAKNLLK